MSKLTVITDRALERALEIAGNAGDGLRQAGNNLRQVAPHAGEWLKTGAAVGAVKTGGKVAGKFVKRNPAVAVVAAVAGLGLLGYAVYRKRKNAQDSGTIEGSAKRIASSRRKPRSAVTPTDSGE